MKAIYCFSAIAATLLLPGSLLAEQISSVPLDFTPGLVKGSTNDASVVPAIAASYKNKVGIIVNPNVEQREDVVRPGKQNVNGPIAALFKGKKGSELAKIAADAAAKNPAQVNLIAAAAIRQNIANGGSSNIDMQIAFAIIDALGTRMGPDAAVILLGLATDRLPDDNLDEGVRTLRSKYLLKFAEADIPSAALSFDTDLVRRGIASAMTLGDDVYAAMTNNQVPGIDTNPFFDGDQGIGNLGTQGGGGGGGGSGGGSSSTPEDPVNPNPPAS